jgi:serine/threonine protein phosphatase 1
MGDIHGCATALRTLLGALQLQRDDTLVTLGDYVDRGPDSRAAVELLLELAQACRLVALRGNHEEMLLDALRSDVARSIWLRCGGLATLRAYGDDGGLPRLPEEHVQFFQATRLIYETPTHFFVHASYDPRLPLDGQPPEVLLWPSLRDYIPPPHVSGKMAIVGHTPQSTGQVLDLGYLKCLDTGCCYGGWLTAMDVHSGATWQANEQGSLRTGP